MASGVVIRAIPVVVNLVVGSDAAIAIKIRGFPPHNIVRLRANEFVFVSFGMGCKFAERNGRD